MNDQDEFDFHDERDRREEAIKKTVDHNSPDPYNTAIEDAVQNLRHLPKHVSSDTILPDIEQYNFSDNRTVGAVVRWLEAHKFIERTDVHRDSTRVGSHLAPRRVYINTLDQ